VIDLAAQHVGLAFQFVGRSENLRGRVAGRQRSFANLADQAGHGIGTSSGDVDIARQFLPGESLLIDRSLVTQADTDDASRAMMLSSITVARAMKMDVTAEGVETLEQAEMVRAAGCDQIQGWLYFKAMPAEAIPQHLDRVAQITPPARSEPEPIGSLESKVA